MGQPFPGLMSFKYHPWTKEMHDCDAEIMVGQKGAQLGFTEVALNKSFFNIDILGNSVLYVLPASTPDATDFSQARFDPALELSPHLANLFSDVKNIGHKRAGSADLFIRGSRSRNQLKSIPVSIVIIDELDEMVQKNIGLIFERMSGQLDKQAFMLSTPTIEHFGINKYYQQSSQDHYFFTCPKCSKWTELVFPDCLVITADKWSDLTVKDSYIQCKECNNKLEHEAKPDYLKSAEWVSTYTDREMRGFHVSQLYSSTVTPVELATAFLRGKENPADEQEFYNSKLGLPHEPKGARVTDTEIIQCTGNFSIRSSVPHQYFTTMGVDVGKWIHFEIDHWRFNGLTATSDINLASNCRVLKMGKVEHFEELDLLMKAFGINFCVVDANPERRKALEFAQRFWGFVRLCFYARDIKSKDITDHGTTHHTISVDRTSWLDLSLGRFRNQTISLPVDTPEEYKSNIKSLVRIIEKDKDGNPVSKYVKTSEDHYAHARNYSELALQMGAKIHGSQNIAGVY